MLRHFEKRRARSAIALVLALALAGCGGMWAHRQGHQAAKKGEWDLAVARYTKALDKDPDNIGYRLSLENARIQASRYHLTQARRHLAAEELEKALDELSIASKYDPANKSASDDLKIVKDRIARRKAEQEQREGFAEMRRRIAPPTRPFLSPSSEVPVSFKITDAPISKVFESLSKLSGVNILIDPDYRADKRISVDLRNLTFEEALERVCITNRLFYKVLDGNTVIVATESPAKRRVYDDLMVQTFYLDNAEANELLAQVKALTQIQKASANVATGAITLVATADQLALAGRIIQANDKARGEVLVEVEILEVNRDRLKQLGLRLSNYDASSTLSPTGAEGEVGGGFANVRAHLLSSLNLSDFILSIPATLTARFLQSDTNTKIIASPRLRAAEGKPTRLRIGEEIPIPITTFVTRAPDQGQDTTPVTSFQFRNVGIEMEITPKVGANGDIALEMKAEFSLLGQDRTVTSDLVIPTFLTRSVSGVLRLRDGETTYIGGLLQTQETGGYSGFPLLGRLVSPTDKRKTTREVIISLTPHLVRGPKVTEDDLVAVGAGTAEVIRMAAARRGQFGASEPEAPEAKPTPPPVPLPPVGTQPSSAPSVPLANEPDLQPPPAEQPPSASERRRPLEVLPRPQPSPAQVAPGAATPTVAAPGSPAPATPPTDASADTLTGFNVMMSPAERSIPVGETAVVDIVVVGARDVRGLTAVVQFDPEAVSITDVSAGSLLTLDGQNVGAEKVIEQGLATVKFTRPSGTSGSGAIATLKVQGLKPGTAEITVLGVTIDTGAGPQQQTTPLSARLVVR